MSRRVVRIALAVAAPVLAVLVLRAFFGDVSRVASGSMEPTLHGDPERGEFVLVRYAADPAPERFDLVVLRRPGEAAPYIKRVVGLPGDTVRYTKEKRLYVNGELVAEKLVGDDFDDHASFFRREPSKLAG